MLRKGAGCKNVSISDSGQNPGWISMKWVEYEWARIQNIFAEMGTNQFHNLPTSFVTEWRRNDIQVFSESFTYL